MRHLLSFQLMFLGIFAVANNFKSLGKFLQISQGLSDAEQIRLSINATLASLVVMLAALFTGESLLNFFGISLDAFRVAGGMVLAMLGIDMIQARKSLEEDEAYGVSHTYSKVIPSVITPIAIPLTTGAGTFSTITIFADQVSGNDFLYFQLFAAILLQALLIFVVFRYSSKLLYVMGKTGISILTRVVGLFTLALGIQFMSMGLKILFPGLGL
ncbi:MAG: NAAT family transporter [Neisseriaceae bacterium]|nr:MAG: NAAT family transporter [Neisseriaceae bacterium]